MSEARHATLNANEFAAQIIEQMQSDDRRAVPWYSVAELVPPFSKTWIYDRVRDGDLDAVTLLGRTLISKTSLDRLLKSSKTWEPSKPK